MLRKPSPVAGERLGRGRGSGGAGCGEPVGPCGPCCAWPRCQLARNSRGGAAETRPRGGNRRVAAVSAPGPWDLATRNKAPI